MTTQNYKNHRQYVPMYHIVLFLLQLAILIGSIVNLVHSIGDHQRLYNASLIVALSVALFILSLLARVFALKAQDRAIRAEENLRHFVHTGKLLDPRLGIRQIVGLRFASDEEFLALAKRAADEDLSEDAIKRAIQDWRADTYRV